ncbi:MAG TPA: hypothetical protein VF516_46585 [Kofleriaceae bacterium]
MLRSFTSALLSEKIEQIEFVEREWETPRGAIRKGKVLKTNVLYHDAIFPFLARALARSGYRLVIINADGTPLSTNPLTVISGKLWPEVFSRLAGRAAGILVVPGTTESVVHEITAVASQYLHRAVFVMPPTLPPNAGEPGATEDLHGQQRASV